MAKRYVALTHINAGTAGQFQVGDEVTGLADEQMKSLWDAGALQEASEAREAEAAKKAEKSDAEDDKAKGDGTQATPVGATKVTTEPVTKPEV